MYGYLQQVFEIFDGIPITVSTNGVLIPQRIKLLEKARAVLCSVEGMEQTTDMVRGRGVWKRVMDGIKLLKDHNVETILRCTYSNENLKDLPPLMDLAEKEDVGLMLFPYLGKPPLDPRNQLLLFGMVTKHNKVWVDQVNYWWWLGKSASCPAGDRRLAVSPNGAIIPCQWNTDCILGRVGDDLGMIMDNARIFTKAFKRPARECYSCKNMGECKSGCLLSKAYLGCPLKYDGASEINALNSFDYKVVSGKISSIRGLLRGVVVC